MAGTRVQFEGGQGQTLSGLLDLPEGGARFMLLFAHCFTCGKDLKVATNVARRLAGEGIGVLRFDFTGLGESGGDFAETTFTSNVDDLLAASAWLGREHAPPAALFGHSLGGAAVLSAAARIDSVRCVATVGAPADPAHVRHLVGDAGFDGAGRARVSIGGRPFDIGKGFVDDLDRHDPAETIAHLGVPLLIFHSPVDTIVGIENAERIYHAAKHPKSFVSLGEADHLVSDARAARFMADVLAPWAGYYAVE